MALALALWASTYQELPGPPLLIGHEGVVEALADLPYLPEDAPPAFLISDRVAAVTDIAEEFEQAVASLGWDGGAVALLDALAARGAAAYLRIPTKAASSACCIRSPLRWRASCCCPGWTRPTGMPRSVTSGRRWPPHVAYDIDRTSPVPISAVPSDEELVECAVASGDEHAIKLTEAALRSFGRTGDPALPRGGHRRLRPPLSTPLSMTPAAERDAGRWLRSTRWSTARSAAPASR